MTDFEQIEDLSTDIARLDTAVRKSLALPAGMDNPAQVIGKLAGLARVASSAASALALVMASARDRELLEAQLRTEAWAPPPGR